MVQQGRVEMMLEIERKMKFPTPDGHKNLAVLKDIATEVRKMEVGEQCMRGRPGGLLPQPAPEELSPMAKEVAKFDEVDRNIMREIATKMIDMYEEEKTSRQTAVGGVGADAGGEARAEIGESDVGPEVP